MLNSFPLNEVNDYVSLAQMIQNLGTENGRAINDQIIATARIGQPPYSVWGRLGAIGPYFYACRSSPYYFVIVGPTTTLQSAGYLIANYVAGQSGGGVSWNNAQIEAYVDTLISMLGTEWWQPTQRYTVAGHSLGGAIVQSLASRMVTPGIGSNSTVNVISFGAPRPGGNIIATNVGRCFPVRFMNPTDPVPLIPPSLGDFTGGTGGFTSAALQAFALFRHPRGGCVLSTTNAPPREAELPTNAGITNAVNLASWLLSQVTNNGSGHSLGSYLSSLVAWQNGTAVDRAANFHVAPAEALNPPRRAIADRAVRAQIAAVFAQGEAQNQPPIRIAPTLQFKAVRDGGIWYVNFQGQMVAVGPDKRRARGLANAGNDILRRLSRQAVVDPLTLGALFDQYLAAASQPNGGVSPPINPVWPS